MLKVLKFGGTSMADAAQYRKIRDIVRSDPSRRVVVVSAAGKRFADDNKITDLLYLCKTHMDHNLPYEQVLQVIQDRYVAAAVGLGLDIDYDQQFQTNWKRARRLPTTLQAEANISMPYLRLSFWAMTLWIQTN